MLPLQHTTSSENDFHNCGKPKDIDTDMNINIDTGMNINIDTDMNININIDTDMNIGVAFFATGPGLGLIMYIFTTLEFPTYNFDFHLLTTSVNAKYYYEYQYSL